MSELAAALPPAARTTMHGVLDNETKTPEAVIGRSTSSQRIAEDAPVLIAAPTLIG